MRITEVKIRNIVDDNSKIKAFASIVFDNVFAVHDIRVVDGKEGLFVAMPSRKTKERYHDIAHPLNNVMRNQIQRMVIAEYVKVLGMTQTGEIDVSDTY